MQMLYLRLTTQSLWTAPHSWVTVTHAKRSFSNPGWEKHIPMDTKKHSYLTTWHLEKNITHQHGPSPKVYDFSSCGFWPQSRAL